MKTISLLFSEERNQLQTDIDNASSIDEVIKLVQNQLDGLEKNYISELNLIQIRLASFFLDMLRQSIATLAATSFVQIAPTEQKQIINSATPFYLSRLVLKILKAVIYLGIFSSLFSLTKTTSSGWMPILLTSLLLGLEVVLQLDKSKLTSVESLEIRQPILKVDSKVFLDNLADAFNTIDLAIARFAEGNKIESNDTIEELPELLIFLQRLLGASFLNKPQMTNELVKLLPQILMSQGIRFSIYQPQAQDSHREYFDFEPSIDPSTKDYVTITPALLKGDRLLSRGRVIEPAYSH